jgi:hypothetical protein
MERVSRKVKKYERLILEMLADVKGNRQDAHVILDKSKRHYQLLYAGTDYAGDFYCQLGIHLHLRMDGVICVFANDTEYELLDFLGPQGIPKSDILVSFLSERMRELAGYAVI